MLSSANDLTSVISMDDNNETYFESKQRKGKSKNSLDLIESLPPNKRQQLQKELTHPIEPELLNMYRKMYKQWCIELKARFNIVFYGLGDKQALMSDFIKQSSLTCLCINGYDDKRSFNKLVKLQKNEFDDDSDNEETMDKFNLFKEYLNNFGSEIIILQGIEVFVGDLFSIKCINYILQRDIRIILTVDDPLALINVTLRSCIYHNVPTAASYSTPIYTNKSSERKSIQLASVGSILSKLNNDAPLILKYIVQQHIEKVKTTRKGMQQYFKSKLINLTTINAVLEELISHSLIKDLNEQGVRVLVLMLEENQYEPLLALINTFV